jgi:pilus assembly protein CpaB
MSEEQTEDQSKKRNMRLFTAALCFALLAGIGTYIFLHLMEKRLRAELTPPKKEMRAVVVATRNLPTGSIVNNSTMAVREVPSSYVENDAITPGLFDSVSGGVLTRPLRQGKILSHDYIDLNIPKDFSGTIRDGYRALTIEVDNISSIAGLTRPNNHVDIYSRLPERSDPALSQANGSMVIPVLEDVLVLATGHRSARPNEDEFFRLGSDGEVRAYDTITLELTPKQAALLSIAQSRGTLIAVLRNSADTSNGLFLKVSSADLFNNAAKLRQAARKNVQKANLLGVHRNSKGQLVTKDGVVITDPNVHLDKDGRLVTANGTLLSGHGLTIGPDGKVHDASGRVVDTASLHLGKDGKLTDNNGVLSTGSGLKKLKNGFYENSKGQVVTPDGHVLSGVTIGPDGTVRTKDGTVLSANRIHVNADGSVNLLPKKQATLHMGADGTVRSAGNTLVTAKDLVTVDKDGTVRGRDGRIIPGAYVGTDGKIHSADGKILSAKDILLAEKGLKPGKDGTVIGPDGKILHAKDLVTVGKDGVVRTKDGTILAGVHIGKDGKLRDKDGHILTAQDIAEREALATPQKSQKSKKELLAEQGLTAGKDGTVVTADGKVLHAKDLVTVGKDGVVRMKDGTILPGVHMGKDGKLRDKDGHILTAQDIAEREAKAIQQRGTKLMGVTATALNTARTTNTSTGPLDSYQVEFITGGNSNGTAKTFWVDIQEDQEEKAANE